MQNTENMSWEAIATQPWFRDSDARKQNQLAMAWAREVAPRLYPEAAQSSDFLRGATHHAMSWRLPARVEYEDQIITPESLTVEGITRIESNPEFARRSYEEQQRLRQTWFQRATLEDERLQNASPEQLQSLFRNVIERAPAASSPLFGGNNPNAVTPLIIDPDTLEVDEDSEQRAATWERVLSNFATTLGGYTVGFMRPLAERIAGPDNVVTSTLRDMQERTRWLNEANEANRFLAQTLPAIAGGVGAAFAPPVRLATKALAGTTAFSAATGATAIPGILQQIGPSAVPGLVYKTAGSATVGVLKGVSRALGEGIDWKTYIPMDATIGVGFSFMGNYLGALRQIRHLARDANVPMRKLMGAPLNGRKATAELQRIMLGNPDMRAATSFVRTADPNGLLYDLVDSPQGLRMKADILGLTVADEGGDTIIRKGSRVLGRFSGPQNKRIYDANVFLDNSDELWPATTRGFAAKSVLEQISDSPQIELRTGSYVPQVARRKIIQTLQNNNVHYGSNAFADPRGDMSDIDRIFSIVRRHGAKKASQELSNRGIVFSPDAAENRAVIQALRAELNEIVPESPHFIVNKTTGNTVRPDRMPQVIFENPDATSGPHYHDNIFIGTPAKARETLANLRRASRTGQTAAKRSATIGGVQYEEVVDPNFVEVRFRVPDADGRLANSILHFNSYEQAQQFLTRAKARGMNHALRDVLGEDDTIRRNFRAFEKTFRQANRQQYERDFIPFRFAQHQAAQDNFVLGTYRGKYILQDALGEGDTTYFTFDRIQDVLNFLENVDTRLVRPNLVPNVPRGAVEELFPEGQFQQPLDSKISYLDVTRNKRVGIRQYAQTQFAPTQYAVRQMENWELIQDLQNRGIDISPQRMYNTIRDSQRFDASFRANKAQELRQIFRGVNARQLELMTDWLEAYDTPAQMAAAHNIANDKVKESVHQSMIQQFGREKADELVSQAIELRRFYNELFSMMDLDANTFLQNYSPRLAREVDMAGGRAGGRIDPRRLTQIPDTDRRAFFEFMRDSDPRDVLYERNAEELAYRYLGLASRKLHIRPTMNRIGQQFREASRQLHQSGATQPADYEHLTSYFRGIMETVSGIDQPSDILLNQAVNNSMRGMAQSMSNILGREFVEKFNHTDVMNKLVTLSTGGHIAGRLYPVARNLTQTMVTGAPLIGPRYWMEGVDAVLSDPSAIRRMIDLGIVDPHLMPTGSGWAIGHSGALSGAVRAGMKPFQTSDWINRAIMYLGMEKRVNSAIRDFSAGKLTTSQFMNKAGARLFGRANYNEMANMFNTAPTREAGLSAIRDRLSRLAVDNTQWLYSKMDSPQAFRGSIGRLFGTYTTWPSNFYNYLREALTSDSMTVVDRAQVLGGVGLVTTALAAGHEAAGMHPGNFMPWSMAMVGPGPYYNLLNNFVLGLNGDAHAMSQAMSSLTTFIPFAYAGGSLYNAISSIQEGEMWEALAHLSSAPFRTELYPRENPFREGIENVLQQAGSTYVQAFRSNPYGD